MNNRVSNWNVANQITAARLIVSLVLFVALHQQWWFTSIWLFLLGATTDWVDGYVARRFQLITQLGRVVDPLADKIIICGTYVFLSAVPESAVPPWMTVVVICRELIVTVIRSFLEQQGKDFSAKMPGKIKMVLQCVVAVSSLLLLVSHAAGSIPSWLPGTVGGLTWAMVFSTLYSGVLYLPAATRALHEDGR